MFRQLEAGWSTGQPFSPSDYGAALDGITDDSVPLRLACQALAAAGGGELYIPPGILKVTLAGCLFPTGPWEDPDDSGGVVGIVPSNTRVFGEPGRSRILQTGVPTTDGTDRAGHYQVFGVADGSSNILFEHLAFRGENDPYTYLLNNQAACIDILLTGTSDIEIRECDFRNLYGFSIHDRGNNQRVHVTDCTFIECANGVNVNSDASVQARNRFYRSEGIEASGANLLIDANLFELAQGVAVSLGGNLTPGLQVRNALVRGNVISESTAAGIVLADGMFGANITGNTITRCALAGITGSYSTGEPPSFCRFGENVIYSNGTNSGSSVGLELVGSDHLVVGNRIFDGGLDDDRVQKYGIIARSTDTAIIGGNYLDGTLYAIEISSTASGFTQSGNLIAGSISDLRT